MHICSSSLGQKMTEEGTELKRSRSNMLLVTPLRWFVILLCHIYLSEFRYIVELVDSFITSVHICTLILTKDFVP